MKNLTKLIGIIALAAVMVFSFVSCKDDDDKDDDKGDMKWTAVPSGTGADQSGFLMSDEINGVAYGDGKWVAVGYGGKIRYSSDKGKTWTRSQGGFSNSASSTIDSVAYGNGMWVVTSVEGTIAHSADCITWTQYRDSDSYAIGGGWSVAHNGRTGSNSRFVVGTYTGLKLYYSSDGVTWADATAPFRYNTIAYGNGKWVAGSNNGQMAYSSDGINWTTSYSTFGTSTYVNCIAYGNNKFVAVGHDGQMAYSADGETWTAVSDSTFGTTDINCVAYGNGRWVAGGEDGKMAYSSNGESWTAVQDDPAFQYKDYGIPLAINGIAYGNGRWVAVCDGGQIAYCNW